MKITNNSTDYAYEILFFEPTYHIDYTVPPGMNAQDINTAIAASKVNSNLGWLMGFRGNNKVPAFTTTTTTTNAAITTNPDGTTTSTSTNATANPNGTTTTTTVTIAAVTTSSMTTFTTTTTTTVTAEPVTYSNPPNQLLYTLLSQSVASTTTTTITTASTTNPDSTATTIDTTTTETTNPDGTTTTTDTIVTIDAVTIGPVTVFSTGTITITTTTDTTVTTIFAITSEALADTYGPKYLILVVDDYNQNHLNKGLVNIATNDTKLSLPSYFTPGQNIALPPSYFVPGAIPVVCDNAGIPIYVQSNPRKLTQAQIYTINTIQQDRNNTTIDRYTGPTTTDVLALIPVKTYSLLPGQPYIEFGSALQTNERIYFGPVNIERMKIQLIDDKGNILNMHGNDWSFTITSTHAHEF
jgi:hypothetical protein